MERISAAVTLKKIWKALGRYFSWNPLANMACTILFSRQVLGWENIVCEIYISSSTFSSLRICIHENRKCMVGCVYAFLTNLILGGFLPVYTDIRYPVALLLISCIWFLLLFTKEYKNTKQ